MQEEFNETFLDKSLLLKRLTFFLYDYFKDYVIKRFKILDKDFQLRIDPVRYGYCYDRYYESMELFLERNSKIDVFEDLSETTILAFFIKWFTKVKILRITNTKLVSALPEDIVCLNYLFCKEVMLYALEKEGFKFNNKKKLEQSLLNIQERIKYYEIDPIVLSELIVTNIYK